MLGGLVVMLVPLPPWLLDGLLALNLGMTTLLLLVTLSTKRSLDLSVFPSLLLLLTLYRLSLNVATTRLILLEGNAGHIVTAFGNYVVGGQLVVGLVVFLILVTIQFMVITKGAGRISEVAARFTLDAMPGKQMAIDAELSAGAIDEKEARRRRDELSRETEFYGAMDGASKFVRGDAVAGLIITGVNLLGGIAMGLSNNMPFGESIRTYSILTIGDGLVSQIPALVIATTAGVLVTKTSSDRSLGDDIRSQMLASDRPIWIGAGILTFIAMMPGLPKLPFLGVAAGLMLLPRRGKRAMDDATPGPGPESTDPRDDDAGEPDDDRQLDDFLMSDRAVVEVGARLVPFIRNGRVKGLSERITALRREYSRSSGQWIPPIRVNSNLLLNPDEYRILIAGRRVGEGELHTEQLLAILPEGRPASVTGVDTTEPAFGLPARWIDDGSRRMAELQGCTVVDPLSVLITHLGEVLKRCGHELLTRESLKQILERARSFAPSVVDEIKPEVIRMGTLHQVLVQLAEDRIPLADIALILESIANHAQGSEGVNDLTDKVRVDLGKLICDRFRTADGSLRVVSFDPQFEIRLRQSLHQGSLTIATATLAGLLEDAGRAWKDSQRINLPLALLVDQSLRRPLRRLLAQSCPDLSVVAYQEVPQDMLIDSVGLLQAAVETQDASGNGAGNQPNINTNGEEHKAAA
jgi:flagellar biosynthesis protein FlhA